MRRVLFVAAFFPPINAVGSIRPAKIAKYLPEHGWEPTVLTVDRFVSRPATMPLEIPAERVVRARFIDPLGWGIRAARGDAGPSAAVAAGSSRDASTGAAADGPTRGSASTGAIVRRRIYDMARRLLPVNAVRVPDRLMTWYPWAVRRGRQVLAGGGFDALLSTSPPPTAQLVAAALARRSGLPWVADMRDPWTTDLTQRRREPWQSLEAALERRTMGRATTVVTVSAILAEAFARRFGRPCLSIPNGFDAELAEAPSPSPLPNLTLTYTGSVYAGLQDPAPLLVALRTLRASGRLDPSQLTLRVYGNDRGDLPALAAAHEVADFVVFHDAVPHPEAMARQREGHALLHLGFPDPAMAGYYSLKIFEYLQAQRPILALGRAGGIVDRLLRECGVGRVLETADEVAAQLMAWQCELAATGTLAYHGDRDAILRYHFRQLAGEFARVLEAAAAERREPTALAT